MDERRDVAGGDADGGDADGGDVEGGDVESHDVDGGDADGGDVESHDVVLPGPRDVRATLDDPGRAPDAAGAEAVVVACPPHPQYGGRRTDTRLRAVSRALAPEIACLRFDYGEWSGGEGELADAGNALRWAGEHFDRVGLFGYSFGGTVALLAAVQASAESDVATDVPAPGAVSALAPAARLSADLDAASALDDLACPAQVVYGERDTTADWQPVVDRARELGYAAEAVSGDHHFVGQADDVAVRVVAFLREHL